MLEVFLNSKTSWVISTDTKGIFKHSCPSSQCDYYEKKFFELLSVAKLSDCYIHRRLLNV